jgi:hypothetical protein
MVKLNDLGKAEMEEHTLVGLLGSLSASALDGLGDVVCGVPGAQLVLK